MGDIADMILEGTLCEQCGVYTGKGEGFPVKCETCKKENSAARRDNKTKQKPRGFLRTNRHGVSK